MIVIAMLHGGGDVTSPVARDEYREIKRNILIQRSEGERSYSEMFRRYRSRLLIAMSSQAFAQLNGINVISYNIRSELYSTVITISIIAENRWYLVDRWGRRLILISGGIIMSIALSLISYFIYLDVSITPQMVVLFVIIFNAFFGYSWGMITIRHAKIRSDPMALSA
jgi:hypothetical protein